MVTKEDIFTLLKKFDIKSDDVVAIHAGLRSIGKIENGADGLIDAVCEYLSDGTLIIPTHTWAAVTPENPVYDVRKSVPCTGTLSEVASCRKDAQRTLHPTHSVAIFGKNKEYFARDEETRKTPTPTDGVMGKFYASGGKVLLIGIGQERNTFIHYVDELLDIKGRLDPKKYDVTIIDYDGNEILSKEYQRHCNAPGINCGCSVYFTKFEKAFDHFNAIKYEKLGNATVQCCEAKKITEILKLLWGATDHDLCRDFSEIPEEYYKNR